MFADFDNFVKFNSCGAENVRLKYSITACYFVGFSLCITLKHGIDWTRYQGQTLLLFLSIEGHKFERRHR